MSRVTALVLASAAIVAAVWLGTSGANFMWELERGDPALSRVEPMVTDPHTPRLARRVYVVIIDGLGRARSSAPFLDSLRAQGLDVGATTHYPSWSRPNYISILTGVPPPASGIRTNYHPMSVPIDSIAARAKAAGMRVEWLSNYPVIPPLLLRGSSVGAVDLDALGDMPHADDRLSAPRGYAWPFDVVRREPEASRVGEVGPTMTGDLNFIVLGDVDRQGHAKGAASEEYREATLEVDRALERALSGVDLSKDAIFVMADHGHVDRGGHGGLEQEVMEVPLIIAGAGVRGPAPADARLVDVSSTVAALLGIPGPGHAIGHVLPVVQLDMSQLMERRRADDARAAVMQRAIDGEQVEWDDDVATRRMWRLPLLVVGIGLCVYAVRLMRVEIRRAWIGAIGVAAIYVAFAWLVQLHLSPSWVPPKDALIRRIVAFSIAGVLLQVAAMLWFARTLDDRVRVAVCALIWALAPAAFAHAVWPRAEVPSPAGLVLYPAVELAGAAGCAAVAISLLVASVGSATRRS